MAKIKQLKDKEVVERGLTKRVIPFTPVVGSNFYDSGWNGCYFEVIDKLVICHLAIQNAPSVTMDTPIVTVPSELVPSSRTVGASCVIGSHGCITGTISWMLD